MGDGGSGQKIRRGKRACKDHTSDSALPLGSNLAREGDATGVKDDMPGVVHKVFLGIYQRLRDCWHFWLMHALALGSLLGEKREGFGFESSPQLNCAVVFPRAAISN